MRSASSGGVVAGPVRDPLSRAREHRYSKVGPDRSPRTPRRRRAAWSSRARRDRTGGACPMSPAATVPPPKTSAVLGLRPSGPEQPGRVGRHRGARVRVQVVEQHAGRDQRVDWRQDAACGIEGLPEPLVGRDFRRPCPGCAARPRLPRGRTGGSCRCRLTGVGKSSCLRRQLLTALGRTPAMRAMSASDTSTSSIGLSPSARLAPVQDQQLYAGVHSIHVHIYWFTMSIVNG